MTKKYENIKIVNLCFIYALQKIYLESEYFWKCCQIYFKKSDYIKEDIHFYCDLILWIHIKN